VRLVPEEEVVRDRHREHGPAPGERARASNEGNLETEMMLMINCSFKNILKLLLISNIKFKNK
jgi:hypothetical protein